MNNLYSQIIIDHSRNPRNSGALSCFDKQITKHNRTCGDELTLFLRFDKNPSASNNPYISGISFDSNSCAISQASASIMTELVLSRTKDEALTLLKTLQQFMDSPDRGFTLPDEIKALSEIRSIPQRVPCLNLCWSALGDLLAED